MPCETRWTAVGKSTFAHFWSRGGKDASLCFAAGAEAYSSGIVGRDLGDYSDTFGSRRWRSWTQPRCQVQHLVPEISRSTLASDRHGRRSRSASRLDSTAFRGYIGQQERVARHMCRVEAAPPQPHTYDAWRILAALRAARRRCVHLKIDTAPYVALGGARVWIPRLSLSCVIALLPSTSYLYIAAHCSGGQGEHVQKVLASGRALEIGQSRDRRRLNLFPFAIGVRTKSQPFVCPGVVMSALAILQSVRRVRLDLRRRTQRHRSLSSGRLPAMIRLSGKYSAFDDAL